jgi:hypothetical protein
MSSSATALSRFFCWTRCGTVVGWGSFGHPVIFPQPATEVDDPAAARAKRIVRVILAVPWHRHIANRTTHVIHRLELTRTSDILSSTGVTRANCPRNGVAATVERGHPNYLLHPPAASVTLPFWFHPCFPSDSLKL